jgi:hypothetical protein
VRYLSVLVLFVIVACGQQEKTPLQMYKVDEDHFRPLVNKKDISTNPDLQSDLFLANYDYPIEVALYKNGKFYYNLDNLGDGHGTWKYQNGMIKMFAERRIFDMHMDIRSSNEEGTTFAITFSDRFGPKYLKLKLINK